MTAPIRPYRNSTDRDQVISLWKQIFSYPDRRNSPALAIDKKLAVDDGLFLVSVDQGGEVVGTVMGGYDGHRGWIYSLAVHRDKRLSGLGTALLSAMEERLARRGCLKVNLQVMPGKADVVRFYEKSGFKVEERISMGKEISRNIPD